MQPSACVVTNNKRGEMELHYTLQIASGNIRDAKIGGDWLVVKFKICLKNEIFFFKFMKWKIVGLKDRGCVFSLSLRFRGYLL